MLKLYSLGCSNFTIKKQHNDFWKHVADFLENVLSQEGNSTMVLKTCKIFFDKYFITKSNETVFEKRVRNLFLWMFGQEQNITVLFEKVLEVFLSEKYFVTKRKQRNDP